ncbi:MAG: histidine phosphatase family protein [Candidatus Hodarchaeales archaeon]|jgi:broad specificity phosphatase PhoE
MNQKGFLNDKPKHRIMNLKKENHGPNLLRDLEWAKEANILLNKIKGIPQDYSMMVVLRHSHRNEFSSFTETHKALLTNEGRKVAYEFGRNLPINRSYRLFHSIHPRCVETAEYIQKGLKENEVQVETLGSLEILWGMAGDYPAIVKLGLKDGQHIVTKWAAGHYPTAIIEPFNSYIQRSANVLWSYHKEAPPSGIDIFITHDFHIMSLQFGWAGMQIYNGWVNFLGGFMVILTSDNFILINKDTRLEIQYPYWWFLFETEKENRKLPEVMESWFPQQNDD